MKTITTHLGNFFRLTFLLLPLCFMLFACSDKERSSSIVNEVKDFSNHQFFELLENTGIHFNNKLIETEEINTITYDGMVQGAGLGVLDINNDGLKDLYFAGNQVSDQLYLNKGDNQFEKITESAGIIDDGTWSTGISIVDINEDGYDDIYVCKFLLEKIKRKNKLYINNKDNTFTESAAQFGLADDGISIMANFLDYDKDGDLDVYIANQPPSDQVEKKKYGLKANYKFTDRLYQNNGGKFIDVTKASGVQNYSYSLSTVACDFNNDGWLDIYVASDYEEPDYLYINQKDGTFKNGINEMFRHIGNFSMGSDIADINNDGFIDLFTVDMVAEDNYRQKTNMSGMNPEKFWALIKKGYHHQYMFNALQLNNGNNYYSEIAQMANISNTDWSWAPIFVDVDQDGNKDVFVTNGIIKEIRNKDFEIWRKKFIKSKKKITRKEALEISEKAPSIKIKNYMLRNNGNYQFEKKIEAWGFEKPSWSQGAVLVDTDNDGDMDLVITNTNQKAMVYKNNAVESEANNFITLDIIGNAKNKNAYGAFVKIRCDKTSQIMNHTPYRGYMSTHDNRLHFGIGGYNTIDELTVTFNNGAQVSLTDVKANQILKINQSEAKQGTKQNNIKKRIFTAMDEKNINHKENYYNDYKREILIPYKLSELGPVVAKGDVNNDGIDDFYLGGSATVAGQLYIGGGNGKYTILKNDFFEADYVFEDGCAEFEDFDKDGDLDLYVCSGGNEYPNASPMYQDRFYLNMGKGKFQKTKALPTITISSHSTEIMDFDGDGDLDILVGGRQIPGQYGRPTSTILLEFRDRKFIDVTAEKAPDFLNLGMVTDMAWINIMGDDKAELVISGEWMPIMIYTYNGKQFVRKQVPSLAKSHGMWNSFQIMDIDRNGFQDIVAGNRGLNNKYKASELEPFTLFVNDFDKNGTNDVYLGFYEKGKCYPVRGRQCSSEQMPFVSEKFESYDLFGNATIDQVLEGKMEGSITQKCYTFAHTVFYNNGIDFDSKEFPMLSQTAPINDLMLEDIDKDGLIDIVAVGNYYGREVETTRSDAGIGIVLKNEGNKNLKCIHPSETGLLAYKDARKIIKLKQSDNKTIIAIANNNDNMQFYSMEE